jgi:uncharacterized protein
MPPAISQENVSLFSERLSHYLESAQIEQCVVVFHGGEPLLVGAERLALMARETRRTVGSKRQVDFSLQTNGTLLKRQDIEVLAGENIGISLSLDGPKAASDLHRLTPKGNSSFASVMRAFKLLQEYPKTFMGILSVVDPRITPKDLFEFFAPLNPPQLDFLLPDANYLTPPPFRNESPDIYVNWLLQAFDLWYDTYPDLKVRHFDTLLSTLAGIPSGTDAFGLGDVTLLSIETDGSYHDLDVLKITEQGASSLGYHLNNSSIEDVIQSPKLRHHRQLLRLEGLSEVCRSCPEVHICGGGAVPHRFNKNGLRNPTIYCREMLSLIGHARKRIHETMDAESLQFTSSISSNIGEEVLEYEAALLPNTVLDEIYESWSDKAANNFLDTLNHIHPEDPMLRESIDLLTRMPIEMLRRLATFPSVWFWTKLLMRHQKGQNSYDIDGKLIPFDLSNLKQFAQSQLFEPFVLHADDHLVRQPFGQSIVFESEDVAREGRNIASRALKIIEDLDLPLFEEMKKISPCIQFIKDPSAHPDKVVSFSDDVLPGALFVSIRHGDRFVDPYDLADSLIHEHRHQKLYILEQASPVVISDTPLIPSPWREEFRPVSGVFHGVFVFHQLKQFWERVQQKASGTLLGKAKQNASFCRKSLLEAIESLENSSLTETGWLLLREFERKLKEN